MTMSKLVIMLWAALIFWGQAPSTPPAVPKTGSITIQPQKAPSDIQARILKLQLQATRIQSQFQACQQQDFQGQYNQVSAQMASIVGDALKDAKLEPKEWDLNLETFEFQKRVVPPVAPVAEPKKP